MYRLTTNNMVSEMGMWELAHNSCYIGENGSARYRDYSTDVDCREMIKKLMVNFGMVESGYWDDVSNEVFDDEMMENLMYGTNNMQGLIALFYRNLWAMADLREKLKYYEDLEEQGLLLKLPCKVGDTVYIIGCKYRHGIYEKWINIGTFNYSDLEKLNKTVFLTKEEAEKALERLEEENV